MPRKTLLAWSSGKDSAWALHVLRQDPEFEVTGLFTTVNEAFNRVAMHAVRVELLMKQAQCAGLPMEVIPIPYPCTNQDYEHRMGVFIEKAKAKDIECMAFGDLFLENVRQYREEKLFGTGIDPVFPLWGTPTEKLCKQIMRAGVKAVVTCIDPKWIPEECIGRTYDESFLQLLPDTVDPCGENGEFHTFAFAGPMFNSPLTITVGETVHRDGFIFADLILQESE